MREIKQWFRRQRNTWKMGKGLSLLIFFLISAYITVTVYGIQPGPLYEVLEYTKTNELLFWMNFVPPFLALGLIWFLTDRLFYS
ncbi:MAG: hypothetical protein II983_04200, partial [Firmicutes bacterium]|nr:hypothetical protein [Bacillota bacterium]